MRREILVGLTTMTLLSVGTGCNRRVFQEVLPVCETTLASSATLSAEKAADILIVVDNSGSMQEEQDRLAAAFINDDPAECPIRSDQLKDFARCDEAEPPEVCRFSNPSENLLRAPASQGGLAQCGFIQVLAAFENDFRIGVITTDVGACDNRIPTSLGGDEWGFRPQRGCLQPNGAPETNAPKIIARQDLLDATADNDDIGARFIATLANIRTYGSPMERGLDAVVDFLDPNTPRQDSCQGDLASFIRDDAKLLVIFLTDEEDCSRSSAVDTCGGEICGECSDPDGCEIFKCPGQTSCDPGRAEFANEVCDDFVNHYQLNDPENCYKNIESLTPVSYYAQLIQQQKDSVSDVSIAVIAGGLRDESAPGGIVAAGCKFNSADGQPSGSCEPSFGSSNTCAAEENCCFADAGNRYYELADAMGGQGLKDTICVDSFNQTMIDIAVFIADVDSLKLAERPDDESLIVVEKAPEGGKTFTQVPRAAGTSCDGAGNGWVLQADGITIRFCGSARPLPGDQIRVAAAGKGANGSGPDACEERGNTRN